MGNERKGFIILCFSLIAVVVIMWLSFHQQHLCEQHGGIWMEHEWECASGIIKL